MAREFVVRGRRTVSVRLTLAAVGVLLAGAFASVRGNDSAASTALGGVRLRREANIFMRKEILRITEARVTVDYEFLNETDHDITTEVAFPIPPYDEHLFQIEEVRKFDDFRLWVEGKELRYNVDARAKLNGTDFTDELNKAGIDIASLGGFEVDKNNNSVGQVLNIAREEQERLVHLGLFTPGTDSTPWMPLWTVYKTYFWRQRFPAHKILHVRHEYTPGVGFQELSVADLDARERSKKLAELRQEAKASSQDIGDYTRVASLISVVGKACVDPGLQATLKEQDAKLSQPGGDSVLMQWVDYILTTANSWKTPIEDFTLIVEHQQRRDTVATQPYISFCWTGPVQKLKDGGLKAHKTNFVPSQDLQVTFWSVPPEKR